MKFVILQQVFLHSRFASINSSVEGIPYTPRSKVRSIAISLSKVNSLSRGHERKSFSLSCFVGNAVRSTTAYGDEEMGQVTASSREN
jgi:hypothetical protein